MCCSIYPLFWSCHHHWTQQRMISNILHYSWYYHACWYECCLNSNKIFICSHKCYFNSLGWYKKIVFCTFLRWHFLSAGKLIGFFTKKWWPFIKSRLMAECLEYQCSNCKTYIWISLWLICQEGDSLINISLERHSKHLVLLRSALKPMPVFEPNHVSETR